MLDQDSLVRLPEAEMKIIEQYCKQSKRTKTDVLSQFIRSLTLTEKKAFMELSVTSGNISMPMGSQWHPLEES